MEFRALQVCELRVENMKEKKVLKNTFFYYFENSLLKKFSPLKVKIAKVFLFPFPYFKQV